MNRDLRVKARALSVCQSTPSVTSTGRWWRDQCHGARALPATCLSKAFSREPLVWWKKWRASGGGAQAGSPGGQEACHLACRVCPPEQSRSLAGACLALSTASLGASDRRAPVPAAADSAGAVAGAEPRPTIITARLQVTTLVSN